MGPPPRERPGISATRVRVYPAAWQNKRAVRCRTQHQRSRLAVPAGTFVIPARDPRPGGATSISRTCLCCLKLSRDRRCSFRSEAFRMEGAFLSLGKCLPSPNIFAFRFMHTVRSQKHRPGLGTVTNNYLINGTIQLKLPIYAAIKGRKKEKKNKCERYQNRATAQEQILSNVTCQEYKKSKCVATWC